MSGHEDTVRPPWPPRSKPVRVSGGLRARSARGVIGQSWWSRRFVSVMEELGGNRLTRGRAYARAGQVLALRVEPGEVTATVQGSRAQPYRVSIAMTPFPELVWAKVEVALAEQAIYSARLLAGEMPPDIEAVFAQAGAPLFPRQLADLSMRCSCPDTAIPCKHLAACCYLLAEEFDTDPFQLLHWRGRQRQTLLARLRQLRGGAPVAAAGPTGELAGPGGPPEPAVGAALAAAELTSRETSELLAQLPLDRFWLPPVPLRSRPTTLAAAPDLLLRQLPVPGRPLGGAGLLDTLRPAYERFASRPDPEDPAAT